MCIRDSGKVKGPGGAAKQSRKNIIGDLKRGNVSVIGKKGDLTNIEGERVTGGQGRAVNGAGAYKL